MLRHEVVVTTTARTHGRVRVLDWDSGFWGIPIAQIEDYSAISDAEIDEQVRSAGIACLYLRIAGDRVGEIHRAELARFRVMDVRLDFVCSQPAPELDDRTDVAPAEERDRPALESIARQAHRATRFFNDPGFADSRCTDLYATW